MRVLWVSHTVFTLEAEFGSGVWQKSLAFELIKDASIVLGNIAPNGKTKNLVETNLKGIKQWAVPISDKKKYLKYYSQIITDFRPDVIHVWGAENFLKTVPFSRNFKVPVILFMQGVLSSIGPLMLKSLTLKEILSTFGIREILTRSNIIKLKNSFSHAGAQENEMIMGSNYIAVQSEWTKSQIFYLKPNTTFFKVNRALREEFLSSKKWSDFKHDKVIIYTAALGMPLKGLDVLIKALGIVKLTYPSIEVRIAGAAGRFDFLGDGYLRHLLKLIKEFNLETNIKWLGGIKAGEIIENLQNASVFVNPSLIESYSLALGEAMAVGTPAVVSYAGAMPELAEPNLEALFFTPLDYKMCAYQILKIINDKELAAFLSNNAIKKSALRNKDVSLVNQHLNIYKEVLEIEKSKKE
jgi:glycosyltransferase involved in cell wall biosynthesis